MFRGFSPIPKLLLKSIARALDSVSLFCLTCRVREAPKSIKNIFIVCKEEGVIANSVIAN